MKPLKKLLFVIGLCLMLPISLWSQKNSKINIEHADFFDINQTEIPDALLLRGNVRVSHDGVVFTCNKAYFFQKENYIKAFGNVQLVQGDTLYLNSKYAEYNGNMKQAFATGNAIMHSPESTLVTDTINFNRNTQEVYYNSLGTITNKENTLKSKSGKYLALHKSAPIGTLIQVKNETNGASVWVKVIGRLPEVDQNQNIIIKLSPKAMARVSPVDKRFRAKINYSL